MKTKTKNMTIKELFQIAIKQKASDLHLVADMPPILRIDGNIAPIKGLDIVIDNTVLTKMVNSILDAEQKKKFKEECGLDMGYSLDGKSRFRINIHHERGNVGLVARVIKDQIPTLEELELGKNVSDILNAHQGLILVTGPTGCGKSSTLAAMINHINTNRNTNIITLEDPIEFLFQSKKSIIIQRQLGSDMVSFQKGLKHVLRQDPDVIMVGEMRDLETIASVVTLAETGHLVLATLHTYSASQTIDRIIDIFPSHQQNQIRMQLSMIMKAIISQKLIPRSPKGRIATREVLINNAAVANLIRENKINLIKTTIETSSKQGMISHDQDLRRLYQQKLITKEVAQTYISDPSLL